MKRLLLACGTSFFLLTGCSDVLERTPQGQITVENFWQNGEQAEQSVNAIYNQLRDFQVHVLPYIGVTDIISDDAEKGSVPGDANFLQEIDDFTHTPSNPGPTGVWSGYYTGIFRTNLAIERIPDVPEMDEDLRARLIGEARFLRGYFYFNLTRWFGDVVLSTTAIPEDLLQSRSSRDEVYELIIEDFTFAAANLPKKSQYGPADLGRATSGAAKAFLAKVHLTRGDWSAALASAEEVIDGSEYSLLPSYQSIFTEAGENASESIFEVQSAAFETGGGGTQYNEAQGVRGVPNLGWGFNRPSDALISAFEIGDPRREATILYEGEILPDGSGLIEQNPNIVNARFNQKAYVGDHPGGNGNGPGNIRILRYADVILIAAEASNELGMTEQALGYVNQIRARARGNSSRFLRDITTTDQQALRTAIWQERRVEFGMEQIRWFDLVRTGRAASVMQALGKDFVEGKHELLPIPQGDIDLSLGALSQNPGYVN